MIKISQKNLNPIINGLKPSATLAINEKSRQLAGEGKKIYRLGFGQSPFPVPESVVEALKENAHQKDYLPVKGLWSLREMVADYKGRKKGLDRTAEDVLIGPGSKELLFLLQLVFYGDLLIPKPSWVSYAPQAKIVGRQVHWISTRQENDWRLKAEELEVFCVTDPDRPRLLILNYPSNPSGTTYEEKELIELAKVARKYRLVLLSDEIYGELHHKGQHVSMAHFYPEGTIVSGGLSKWCGAGGWRLGTFTFPTSLGWLRDALAVAASETFTATSAPIQYAAVRAFEGGKEIETYLADSRRVLATIVKGLSEKLVAHHISHPKPQGAFYLFPNFEHYRENLAQRGILTSMDLCNQLLLDSGVALLPASDFGFPPEVLAARLSYVDFDGGKSLKLIRENQNDESFLDAIAPQMLEGIGRMTDWLK